jgi:uncharacterized caspase-like protein
MRIARFAICMLGALALPLGAGERSQPAVSTHPSGPQRGADLVAEPRQELRLPTYHALIIANKNYRSLSKLETPFNDAIELGRILAANYGFKSENISTLRDATRNAITAKLADLRSKLTVDDSLLIYYAGHGHIDTETERGYWLPVDAERDNEGNWVSNDDITNYLKGMRARQVLVVADSCYSGTLTRDDSSLTTRVGGEAEWIKRMLERRARTALTSGGLEPVMDKGGKGHSAFAQAFLDVLRENDQPREMDDLFQQIKRRVVLNARQTPEYGAIRLADHEARGDFVFVPANAVFVPRREPPPPVNLPPPPPRKPDPVPPSLDIAGTWRNPANPMLWYVFSQQGTTVTVQEIDQAQSGRRVTAEGTGQLDGRMLTLTLSTIFGTGGMSVLTLSSDGRSLTGTYTDHETKQTRMITLSR